MRAHLNQSTKGPRPLVLIDVDDKTWRQWGGGEPERAPRGDLLRLIRYAIEKGSRYVIVDILVEGKRNAEDEGFASQINDLLNSPNWHPNQHLILVRSIRAALDPRGADELRESVLDKYAAQHSANLHIAAPYFKYSGDHILRDWDMWRIVCHTTGPNEMGYWAVIPSIQLLVASLEAGLDISKSPFAGKTGRGFACTNDIELGPDVLEKQQKGRKEVENEMWKWFAPHSNMKSAGHTNEILANRIVYRFGNTDEKTSSGQDEAISANPVLDIRGLEILNNSKRATSASLNLNGAITVIGQSFAETRDYHATPIGSLSGPLVILNSIDSMLRHPDKSGPVFNVLTPPSTLETWAIIVFLVVSVGCIYARWDSVIGTLITTGGLLFLLTILSYHAFKHGVWLDLAAPIIAIELHRLLKSFEEYIEHRKLRRLHGDPHLQPGSDRHE